MVRSVTTILFRGFTLFEVVIYLALFSVLVTSGLTVTFGLLRSTTSTDHAFAVQNAGDFIQSKFHSALIGTVAISFPASSTLRIVRADTSASPFVFHESGGVLYLARGAGGDVALSDGRYRVHDVSFMQQGDSCIVIFWIDDVSFYDRYKLYAY